MTLIIECIVACIVFGLVITISVLKNKELWLYEYPEVIQKRYIETHPNIDIKEPEKFTFKTLIKKIVACLIFLVILSILVYIAKARTFIDGTKNAYLIWFVVNTFDTIFLDCGLMVHYKKFRLPGTEDMDKEYKLLIKKSLIDGIYGCIIGIPVSLLTGLIIFML